MKLIGSKVKKDSREDLKYSQHYHFSSNFTIKENAESMGSGSIDFSNYVAWLFNQTSRIKTQPTAL